MLILSIKTTVRMARGETIVTLGDPAINVRVLWYFREFPNLEAFIGVDLVLHSRNLSQLIVEINGFG